MKNLKWVYGVMVILMLAAGCSQNEDSGKTEGQQLPAPNETADDGADSEPSAEDEQKQMAIDMLNDLAEHAKDGKVYRPDQSFIIGTTTRDEVYDTIGEPEETEGGFDHYHGSMGNPSIAFSYDQDDKLEEARNFGTNVERQTNLGGITESDLKEQLGEPEDVHLIQSTGEKNIRYHIGNYDLQFVLAKDGTTDHVNLKKWQQ